MTSCSIHVPLHEHETAEIDFSTWPQAVQNIHVRELELWAFRNPTMDIVDQKHSFDYARKVTCTEWDYVAKAVPA